MVALSQIKDKSNYCPYPFSQITTTPHGKWKLCCSSAEGFGHTSDFPGNIDLSIKKVGIEDYWNGDYLNWVRENHLAGIPIKECASCKEYEAHGVESYRNRAIKERGFLEGHTKNPISLDLKLGNRCNAACLFCDPTSSSLIQKEWQQLGWDKAVPFSSGLTGQVDPSIFLEDYSWPENLQFWEELKNMSSSLKNIKFTGGEPLVNPYIMPYLEYLVSNKYSRNIRLQITTNGIYIPRKFLQLLGYFDEVQINFSVDGVGKRNEYIRYPTNWDSWLKNIKAMENFAPENVDLCLQHSYSFYSLFYLDELMEFIWDKKRFGFHQFKVNHPQFQRPELLDPNDKSLVLKKAERTLFKLKKVINSERDQFLYEEFTGIVDMVKVMGDNSAEKPLLKDFLIQLDLKRKRRLADFMPLVAKSLGITKADYE